LLAELEIDEGFFCWLMFQNVRISVSPERPFQDKRPHTALYLAALKSRKEFQ